MTIEKAAAKAGELLAELVVLEVRPEHRPGRGRFWRPDGQGYTGDPAKAGIWTRATAPRSDRAEPVPALGLVPVLELARAVERLGNPGRVWNALQGDGHAEERQRADDRASAWPEGGRIRWVVDFTPPGVTSGAKVSSHGLADTWEAAEAAAGDVIGLFVSGPRWAQKGETWPNVRFVDQEGEGEILGLDTVPGFLWSWRGSYAGEIHRAEDLERAVGLAEAFFAAEVLANMVGSAQGPGARAPSPARAGGGETCWRCEGKERFEGAICDGCGSVADGRGGVVSLAEVRAPEEEIPPPTVRRLTPEEKADRAAAGRCGSVLADLRAQLVTDAATCARGELVYLPEKAPTAKAWPRETERIQDRLRVFAVHLRELADRLPVNLEAELDGYRDAVTIQARLHEHGHELAAYQAIRDRYERAIAPRATPSQRVYAEAFDRVSAVFETAREDGRRGRGEDA